MTNTNPVVSVYITTFNQEKYIRKALDSVLMQKTDFKFEIIIGDDASTDSTPRIIKEYKENNPELIEIILREKNIFGSKIDNFEDLRRRCKGDYIICLEGDDFWIDENKLQKQVDFLNSHLDYIATAHSTVVVDENSEEIDEKYPECESNDYSLEKFASEIMPGQLTTILERNPYLDNKSDISCFEEKIVNKDRLVFFYLASHGKINCSREKMSAYRHIKDSGNSFSANYQYDFENDKRLYAAMIKASEDTNNQNAKMIAEMLYYKNLMQGFKQKQCAKKDIKEEIKTLKDCKKARRLYLKQWINHHILHKRIWI